MTHRQRVAPLSPVSRCSAGLALLVWSLCSGSCQLDSRVSPHTQMVIDIDADRTLRARTQQLSLVVVGDADRAALSSAPSRVDRTIPVAGQGPYWPLREVVEPQGGDADRFFMLTAIARGEDEAFLAQVRVVSGYVVGEVRHISLRLTVACAGMMCSEEQTCTDGSCADAWLDPREQPYFDFEPAGNAGRGGDLEDGGSDRVSNPKPDGGDGDAGSDPLMSGGVQIDVCAVDHGGCDVLVSCQIARGQRICGVCPAGYEDVHSDGTSCRDRNECLDHNGGCDPAHGRCLNTPGRFECRCADGFHGDGKFCSENVPCENDAGCAEAASCKQVSGQKVCVCNAGLQGNGGTCSDVDECASAAGNDCDHAPEACVNELGGYHCTCPAGFSGDGRGDQGCVDDDECILGHDDCDDAPDACQNTEGGFTCKCPVNFTGSGRGANGCVDLDECADNRDDCASSPDACVNDKPGFHCKCPSGYSGDGRGDGGCKDIDECSAERGGCSTQRECVNAPGSFHCGACPAGYGANGTTSCLACACWQASDGEAACGSSSTSAPIEAATAFGGSRGIGRWVLFGYQITLPANARVSSFGAIRTRADTLPSIAMALYTDAGGLPGARVVRTADAVFRNYELTLPAISDAGGCLAAGSYWLLGLADSNLTLGQDTSGAEVPFVSVSNPSFLLGGPVMPTRWSGGPGAQVGLARMLNMYVTFDHP